MAEFPKAMQHPGARQGKANLVNERVGQSSRGLPDINPPVTVDSKAQEDAYRARGYRAAGEIPPVQGYADYPKWMTHPERGDRTATDAADEQAAIAAGYAAKGTPDASAFESARASPYDPGRVTQEYPRYENGVLVQDPDAAKGGPVEYPKWCKAPDGRDVCVKSRAEEEKLTGPRSPELVAAERDAKRAGLEARKKALEAETAALEEEMTAPAAPVPAKRETLHRKTA
jgi:hypothetical protein